MAHTLVGRSSRCDVRVEAPNASAVHASLVWKPGGWHVRDHQSRNGTFLGERRVEPGQDVPLDEGAVLAFGMDNVWLLASAAPPVAIARPVGGEGPVVALGGLLTLGNPDEPTFSVYLDAAGTWIVEDDHGTRAIEDGHVVHDGARAWVLRLPPGVPRTHRDEVVPPHVDNVELVLEVSLDEEHVHAVAEHTGGSIDLGARAFHYLLVTLARLRCDDRAGGVSEDEAGWVHMADLERMLSSSENRINVAIHRARRLFADCGIEDAARVVERRTYRRQLRLGVRNATVVSGIRNKP